MPVGGVGDVPRYLVLATPGDSVRYVMGLAFHRCRAKESSSPDGKTVALLADVALVVAQEYGIEGDAKFDELLGGKAGTLGPAPSGDGEVELGEVGKAYVDLQARTEVLRGDKYGRRVGGLFPSAAEAGDEEEGFDVAAVLLLYEPVDMVVRDQAHRTAETLERQR